MGAPFFFTKTSSKYITFMYDFAVHGGAISSIGLGVFLPLNFQALTVTIHPVSALTSGGVIAVVDLGIAGSNSIVGNVAQGTAGTFVDYNVGTWGFGYTAADLVPSFTFPANTQTAINNANPAEIEITISADTLTGGKFVGTIHYLEIFA